MKLVLSYIDRCSTRCTISLQESKGNGRVISTLICALMTATLSSACGKNSASYSADALETQVDEIISFHNANKNSPEFLENFQKNSALDVSKVDHDIQKSITIGGTNYANVDNIVSKIGSWNKSSGRSPQSVGAYLKANQSLSKELTKSSLSSALEYVAAVLKTCGDQQIMKQTLERYSSRDALNVARIGLILKSLPVPTQRTSASLALWGFGKGSQKPSAKNNSSPFGLMQNQVTGSLMSHIGLGVVMNPLTGKTFVSHAPSNPWVNTILQQTSEEGN